MRADRDAAAWRTSFFHAIKQSSKESHYAVPHYENASRIPMPPLSLIPRTSRDSSRDPKISVTLIVM